MLVDKNSARPAELLPLLKVVSILVENLNPVVVAIADEQAPFGIEGQAMRQVEFPRAGSFFPPRLDEFPIFRKLHDAGGGMYDVSIGHANIGLWGGGHRGKVR